MAIDQRGNVLLGKLLAELAWSPSRLTEAVNGLLGPGYVGRSTVSEWLHQDRVPRHPLPTVVAHLISDALDREVSVDELWSSRARRAELWVPADDGPHLPWTAAGTVDVLDDWLRHVGGSIGLDRRIFLAVRGRRSPHRPGATSTTSPAPGAARSPRWLRAGAASLSPPRWWTRWPPSRQRSGSWATPRVGTRTTCGSCTTT